MHEGISNHYHPGMIRPKLDVTTRIVFEPTEDWNYAHHPYLVRFRGRFFLCFSSGVHHEDDVGQRVMFTGSDDFVHWDEPRVLALPDVENSLLIPAGTHVTDESLVVYYHKLVYQPEVLKDGHRRMGSAGRSHLGVFCRVSTDGVHFGEEIKLPCFGGNMPVRRLKSGRLLAVGGREHCWSDETDGIHGWHSVYAFPVGHGNEPGQHRAEDDLPGLVSDTHVSLCEGSFIQQDSGRIWLYLRSATPWLWACYSDDEGESWSLPERTNFSDNRTKFFMNRLPNGRYYYVGTPDPFPPRTRHTLALSLSEDGLDWQEHYLLADAQYKGRWPGIDKNGVYGYPTVMVEGDDMYLAVSINKEMIAVMHADLGALRKA